MFFQSEKEPVNMRYTQRCFIGEKRAKLKLDISVRDNYMLAAQVQMS